MADPGSTVLRVGSEAVAASSSMSGRAHDSVGVVLRGVLLRLGSQECSLLGVLQGSGDGDREGTGVEVAYCTPDTSLTPSPPDTRERRGEGGRTLLQVLIQWALIYGVPVLLRLLISYSLYAWI